MIFDVSLLFLSFREALLSVETDFITFLDSGQSIDWHTPLRLLTI